MRGSEYDTILLFSFFNKDGPDNITNTLIEKVERYIIRNRVIMMDIFEGKPEIYFTEDTMGLSSDIHIQWTSVTTHQYLLKIPTVTKSLKKKRGTRL